jgi:RHS repeat-associated protein
MLVIKIRSTNQITDTWTYIYDGDGIRVKEEYSGTGDSYTKYYFAGGAYEVEVVGETTTTKRYYSIAGMMVAMHDGTDLVYFANDHLSSASLVMDASGTLQSENRYKPFGEVRDIGGVTNITETDFGYTGQRNIADIGLMDYDARFYSPTLGRFLQPDTIVPNPGIPQSWNRFSYALNSPINFTDPSGHVPCLDGICLDDDIDVEEYLMSQLSIGQRTALAARKNRGKDYGLPNGVETCTMFTSEAMAGGGRPFDEEWYPPENYWDPGPYNQTTPQYDYLTENNEVDNLENGIEYPDNSEPTRGLLADDSGFIEALENVSASTNPGDIVFYSSGGGVNIEGENQTWTHAAVVVGSAYDPRTGMIAPLIVDSNGPYEQDIIMFIYDTPNEDIWYVAIVHLTD